MHELLALIGPTIRLSANMASALYEAGHLKGGRADDCAKELEQIAALLDALQEPAENPDGLGANLHAIAALLRDHAEQ